MASAVTAGVALGVLTLAPAAFAHDAVVGGNPADGAVIDALPDTITLDFSGVPKEGYNTLALSNQDGEILFSGEPAVVGQSIVIDVPEGVEAGPGDYIIGFQITSSDGHATRGKTSFTIAGEGEELSPASEVAASNAADPGMSMPAKVGIAMGLVAVMAVVAITVSAKTRNKQ